MALGVLPLNLDMQNEVLEPGYHWKLENPLERIVGFSPPKSVKYTWAQKCFHLFGNEIGVLGVQNIRAHVHNMHNVKKFIHSRCKCEKVFATKLLRKYKQKGIQ